MTKNAKKQTEAAETEHDFMATLEAGVRKVLAENDATAGERIAAINAGAKLLMIRHKISGGDEKGFFDK